MVLFITRLDFQKISISPSPNWHCSFPGMIDCWYDKHVLWTQSWYQGICLVSFLVDLQSVQFQKRQNCCSSDLSLFYYIFFIQPFQTACVGMGGLGCVWNWGRLFAFFHIYVPILRSRLCSPIFVYVWL